MNKEKKKIYLDLNKGTFSENAHNSLIDHEKGDVTSVLFSRGKIANRFFTEDSKLYITPREQELMDQGIKLDRRTHQWDCLSSRIIHRYQQYRPSTSDALSKLLERKYQELEEDVASASKTIMGQFTMVKMWNLSIIGAILFGMVTMTMIYRYLGQGAAAGTSARANNASAIALQSNQAVLGVETSNELDELVAEAMNSLSEDRKKEDFENQVREMVKGYPIEEMVPYILEKDRTVASFIIAIGKKESNWGKRVPVLNGQDCYNYWGYRGIRKLMGTGGHTCFNSRKDAVDTIAKRIETLVEEKKLNTPEKMVVWKCGSTCAGHGKYDVQKWIDDVDMYFQKLEEKKDGK